MTKRRARLNDDNDPLSSTDKVLAGFEQISKSASQQDEVSTSKEADLSTSQQSKSEHTFEASTSQQNNTPIIQLNSNSTSQKANLLTSQQVNLEKVSLRKSTFQISEEVLHRMALRKAETLMG